MAQDKYHRFPFKSFDILKYESVSSIAHHINALKWFKKQLVIWENQFFSFSFGTNTNTLIPLSCLYSEASSRAVTTQFFRYTFPC